MPCFDQCSGNLPCSLAIGFDTTSDAVYYQLYMKWKEWYGCYMFCWMWILGTWSWAWFRMNRSQMFYLLGLTYKAPSIISDQFCLFLFGDTPTWYKHCMCFWNCHIGLGTRFVHRHCFLFVGSPSNKCHSLWHDARVFKYHWSNTAQHYPGSNSEDLSVC